MSGNAGGRGSFSTLQHLLQLSYSEAPEDQQKSAIELARLIEGTVFPAVSFGPLAHALSRLVPSKNRTVSSYSSKALKLLLLDDALRPQAVTAGVAAVVCTSIAQWEDEVLCLRELLGALQTLSWDKSCVKSVIQGNVIEYLIDFVQASDQEVSVLALATLANILVIAIVCTLRKQLISANQLNALLIFSFITLIALHHTGILRHFSSVRHYSGRTIINSHACDIGVAS